MDQNVFDEHTSKIANAVRDAGEEVARATSHWLGQIAGTLNRMEQYMDRIDTKLERMNDNLDRIIQEL